MAELLQDERWPLSDAIPLPSAMIDVSKPQLLDYEAAASFVRYLRDRFGMPALLELYAALDGVSARGTPDVFLAVLGVQWDDVESGYRATYLPVAVGSINCDFPVRAPVAGAWTIPIDAPCEDAATIGPFLGWYNTDAPYSERYVTLEIAEAGVYTVAMTSSTDVSVHLLDCDEPGEYYAWYDSRVDEAIEMAPGRKRLRITAFIDDAAVGEVVLRHAPPTTPVTREALGRRSGLPHHGRGHFRADSGAGPV